MVSVLVSVTASVKTAIISAVFTTIIIIVTINNVIINQLTPTTKESLRNNIKKLNHINSTMIVATFFLSFFGSSPLIRLVTEIISAENAMINVNDTSVKGAINE